MTISRMRRHAPSVPTDPNICMCGGVTDVINCAKILKISSWFRSWKTLKNGISHWDRSTPLQQCCATVQTVITYIKFQLGL